MIFDMPSCGGCKTCELGCSFHHEKVFNPEISSLKILEKDDRRGYKVEILEERQGNRYACDGCKELKVPLCVQYCKEEETLKQFIKDVLKKKSGKS